MAYHVTIKASAAKEIEKLPRNLQPRILDRIALLAGTARPHGSTKLQAAGQLWRVRIGDYRIIYAIDDRRKLVDVRIVAHRREVYRDL